MLCTASVDPTVPPWMVGKGRGWITAEYSMLPGSTSPRKKRDVLKVDGRTTEIQRLIGRSLRAIVDLDALGERTIAIDCDVLEADGGTRTASITGAMVALIDALAAIKELPDPSRSVLLDTVAAVSVGIVNGEPVLDLDYIEDVAASMAMPPPRPPVVLPEMVVLRMLIVCDPATSTPPAALRAWLPEIVHESSRR